MCRTFRMVPSMSAGFYGCTLLFYNAVTIRSTCLAVGSSSLLTCSKVVLLAKLAVSVFRSVYCDLPSQAKDKLMD